MNVAGLVYLLIVHFLSGNGLLKLFKIQLKPLATVCMSLLLGIPLLSFAPCLLQLLHIPITGISVFCSVDFITGMFCIPLLAQFSIPSFKKIVFLEFYEWPFLIVCLLLAVISIWRCFYLPPYSRDMLSGPELLAEYAVREHTMISSVFNVDLSTSNNYFKSPYVTSLQIIYKLLVHPFGQLWLSILFVAFTTWIYTVLRERVHPFFAGLLLLLFVTIPELYAYTYMALYDYSNMVFFFCGYYFLARYFESGRANYFPFSIFLFGIATYIRAETLILVVLMLPLVAYYCREKKLSFKQTFANICSFFIVPAAFWFLCLKVFIRFFIPIPFDVTQSINPHLGDVSGLLYRLQEISTKLIFSRMGLYVYGWYFLLFCCVFLADMLWIRRFNRESLIALYGIFVIYVGLGLIGYLLPLADLENTTKRGMFKALPIMLLYLSNSGLVLRISNLFRASQKF